MRSVATSRLIILDFHSYKWVCVVSNRNRISPKPKMSTQRINNQNKFRCIQFRSRVEVLPTKKKKKKSLRGNITIRDEGWGWGKGWSWAGVLAPWYCCNTVWAVGTGEIRRFGEGVDSMENSFVGTSLRTALSSDSGTPLRRQRGPNSLDQVRSQKLCDINLPQLAVPP